MAVRLLAHMLMMQMEPNVVSFSAMISATEKGLHWQQALQCLQEMPNRKVCPNVVSISAALSACGNGVNGQWQHAWELFAGLFDSRTRANVISNNAVMSALEKGYQWQQAMSLFESAMQSNAQPNVSSLTICCLRNISELESVCVCI